MVSQKTVLKYSDHRWMGLFFIGAALLAYFLMDSHQSLVLKAAVVLGCGIIGLRFVIVRSQDRLWLEENQLCYSQVRGKKRKSGQVPIDSIKAVQVVFSGNRSSGQSWVRHNCFVVTTDGKRIKLPDGIKYCSYQSKDTDLSFLVDPLKKINPNIYLEIDDSAVMSQSK